MVGLAVLVEVMLLMWLPKDVRSFHGLCRRRL